MALLVFVRNIPYELDILATCKDLYDIINIDILDELVYQNNSIPNDVNKLLADTGISNEVHIEVRRKYNYCIEEQYNHYMRDRGEIARTIYINLVEECRHTDDIEYHYWHTDNLEDYEIYLTEKQKELLHKYKNCILNTYFVLAAVEGDEIYTSYKNENGEIIQVD